MKKGLKIGMLTLAICATAATLISTGKVEAEDKTVQVIIGQYNSGQNTCTLGNYIYNFTASTAEDAQTTGNILECKFGKQDSQAVTLQLSGDLKSGSGNIIPKTGVLLSNDPNDWAQIPNIGTATSHSNDPFYADYVTLFDKDANVIGTASGTVNIKVIVPGGTPDGTYQGTLVFSYGG